MTVTSEENASWGLKISSAFPNLTLGAFSGYTDSHFDTPNSIEKFSWIHKSKIGKNSHLGVASYIGHSVVGNYCNIGSRVSIGGFEHPLHWLAVGAFQWGLGLMEIPDQHATKIPVVPVQRPAILEGDNWIGNNAIVKQGVRVSIGAVVGAGAVVTRYVAPYEIVGGVPARTLGFRFKKEIVDRLLSTSWWMKDYKDIAHLPFSNVAAALSVLEDEMKTTEEV